MRVSGLSMNVQTIAQRAQGNGFLSAVIANYEPEGFRESLWDAIELLRADYTAMKLLCKEFPLPTACFVHSATFAGFLIKWFPGAQEGDCKGVFRCLEVSHNFA